MPTAIDSETRRAAAREIESDLSNPSEGRRRAIVEAVEPCVDAGRFAVKRVVGETVVVEADVFTDGHDAVAAIILYKRGQEDQWSQASMTAGVNDHWVGQFSVDAIGPYQFAVAGWVDRFATWQRDLRKRIAASQHTGVDLLIGADLVAEAAAEAEGAERDRLTEFEGVLRSGDLERATIAEDEELTRLVGKWLPRHRTVSPAYPVFVDRPKAKFSAWYELFPRSASEDGGHGTLRDVGKRLPYVAAMGFDVLYLPPIHPVGRMQRKGRNNAEHALPDDVGSPWAIGAKEGGHKAIEPKLGTMDDFRWLVGEVKKHDIELAMDVALQCAPDHPYVTEHPEWFRKRPDGTIQYAENPPKKYQDIYPFDFECDQWESLWEELKSIFLFWIDEGVRIFRVDNPHTKPFIFWDWVIAEIRRDHPDVIFLAEAFTRPKIMYRLAKGGFTQSYTYFAWRDTKWELTQYVNELTKTRVKEFFRPNFWPNTPDILPESLQVGGRAAFMTRLVLAATLSGNYGIYGPPFEHGWSVPREPGSEEYLHSEKYEVHQHDLDRRDSLKDFIAHVNRARRSSPALAKNASLEFHETDNDHLLCYSLADAERTDSLLVVVNLDPHHRQSGWISLPLEKLDLPENRPFQMHDLLTDARYLWHGSRNYVELDGSETPAHIFRLRTNSRTERDFEYFL